MLYGTSWMPSVSLLTRMTNKGTCRNLDRRLLGGMMRMRHMTSVTRPLLEKRTIKVPTMGDSITEGTIVEWTAEIGQAVKDGDVIALVETDKVTIEIKAQIDGVITQKFGAVDDTVAVGSNLYELDTEGTVSQDTSIQTSAPIEAVKETAKVEPIVINSKEPIMETGTASEHRSPTIKFLGKSGWEAALKGHSSEPAPIVVAVASKPNAVTTIVDDTIIHPMYGRPRFTDTEMEALITGGATIAPLVLMHSSGAKFK